jgi:hypothetical protein
MVGLGGPGRFGVVGLVFCWAGPARMIGLLPLRKKEVLAILNLGKE